jgi:SPP1 gp7 family putative phage head morphogenesis protein
MTTWRPPQRAFTEYAAELRKLFGAMLKGPLTQERLQSIAQSPKFLRLSEETAKRMIAQQNVRNARSWRAAASKSMRGREVFNALQSELHGSVGVEMRRLVTQNAALIQSLPEWLAEKATRYVSKRQIQGARAATIAQELRPHLSQLSESRISLIARTETMKSITALTRARAEAVGAGFYIWSTSRDSRVRKSHRYMDQVICPFDDDPAPEALIGEASTLGHYGPGESPGCRCDSQPLIDTEEISWPARVYGNGAVTRMTRSQFLKINGIPRAA